MTEVAQRLPPSHSKITYTENCSERDEPATLLNPMGITLGLAAYESLGRAGSHGRQEVTPPAREAKDCGLLLFKNSPQLQPITSRGVMDDAIKALIDKAVREALETAAKRLEALSGNVPYEKAWRRAAREVRSYKPD